MNTFTNKYRWSHGRNPRGKGMWVFEITFVRQGEYRYTTEEVHSTGMYTQAKRNAIRSFKSRPDVAEVVAITVMP